MAGGIVPETPGKTANVKKLRNGRFTTEVGISPTTSLVSLTASMVTRPFELHSMPDQFLQQSVIGSHVVKTEALLNWDLIPSKTFLSFVLHILVEKERLREEIKRKKVKIKERVEVFW